MIRNILKKIGFSEKEMDVYLQLLEIGTQPASVIAKRLSIPKSSVFDVLSAFAKEGIISRHIQNKVHYFSIPDPKNLLNYLNRKESIIKTQQRELTDVLPDLYAFMNPYALRPKVETYEGWEGIKTVLDDTLSSETEILAYVYIDGWVINKDLYEYCRENNLKRSEKGIFERGLVAKTPIADKFYKSYTGKSKLSEFRWLSSGKYAIQNEISIYEDKVSIASINVEDQLGIIIQSQKIADTQRAIFEAAWSGSKKMKKVQITETDKVVSRTKLMK